MITLPLDKLEELISNVCGSIRIFNTPNYQNVLGTSMFGVLLTHQISSTNTGNYYIYLIDMYRFRIIGNAYHAERCAHISRVYFYGLKTLCIQVLYSPLDDHTYVDAYTLNMDEWEFKYSYSNSDEECMNRLLKALGSCNRVNDALLCTHSNDGLYVKSISFTLDLITEEVKRLSKEYKDRFG